jgi:hypothetical protein
MNFQDLQAQYDKRMEECGGDPLEYQRRYNRHTLKLTLLNEQNGEEEWGDYSITFYNEDNAINHLSVVGKFMELLTKEENRDWGYAHTEQKVVDNILDPIKKILGGKNN